MTDFRILVVEDNPDNMTLVVDMLTAMDYGIIQAVNGQDGVDKARQEKPDLILMDLSLPVLDGWSAAKLLKDDEVLAPIPIIALTAHAMAGDRERALEAGCDDYMTKPLRFAELMTKLNEHLGHKSSG